MKRSHLVILAGLLIVLGVVCVRNSGPFLKLIQNLKGQSVPAPQPPPPPLSLEPILADGSYNPISPVKVSMADDPTTMLTRLAWRERYQPSLNQIKTAPSEPGFYVYPMLDRTPEGVGMLCTYGWRLTGSAALAQWTDARLSGMAEPVNYGLPTLDSIKAKRRFTFDDWTSQSLADPAARDARYMLTGVFDFNAADKKYQYKVVLLDRQATEAAVTLATTTSATRGDFESLAAFQRSAARAVANGLIQRGLVRPRKAPPIQSLDLKKELSEISMLLDSGDSWTMMEGIDRSLALSELFPEETAPLQAAAYGYAMLGWAYFSYGMFNVYEADYSARAFALSQIARAMDDRPIMTRLVWDYTCTENGMARKSVLGSLADPQNKSVLPELTVFRNIINCDQSPGTTAQQREALPYCQLLWTEMARSRFIGGSDYRDQYIKLINYWTRRDLFMQAMLQGFTLRYNYGGMDQLRALSRASSYVTAGTLAAELAAVLVTLGPGDQSKEMIDKLSSAMGDENPDQKVRWDAEKMAKLVSAKDYFGLRQHLVYLMARWDPPEEPNHPAYRILADLENRATKIIQDPAQGIGVSSFCDFEFSPSRRVRFTSQRDVTGSLALAEQNVTMLGVYEAFNAVAAGYLRARPSNANALSEFAGYYEKESEQPGAVAYRKAAVAECSRIYPIDNETYFNMGEILFDEGRREAGLTLLAAYTRTDPFNSIRNQNLGHFYREHAYHAMAVRYLGEYLKDFPDRYDIANERAWSLCQMGRWKDPEVRATFERPVRILTGNDTFHENNLEYLLNWAEDYKTAREMADFYGRCAGGHSVSPWIWKANIENADNNTTKALEILQNIPIPRVGNIQGLAYVYCQIADALMNYNRVDLAEPFVRKAANTDSWMQYSIQVMGKLAHAKGNYDQAIKEYERSIERYGFSVEDFRGKLWAMEKKGDLDQVISLLESKVFLDNTKNQYILLYTRLMRLYAETNRKEKVQALMDLVLTSPYRTRGYVLAAEENYKKFYPKEAADIEKRIDEIMAGPDLDK